MNRILRGAILLSLVSACGNEPGFEPEEATRLIADPVVLFVPLGKTDEVLVRLVDSDGTSLPAEITVTSGSAGVIVAADPLFRPVFGADGSLHASSINAELRFTVTGAATGSTTLTASSGEAMVEIRVTVTP